jgi:hypothetical protein
VSTIIMSACWPLQGMSPTQKAVLISLSDNANDEGVCWPSVARIAIRTCLSERAVQNSIKWLSQAKILTARERMGRSTIYTLTPEAYSPPQEMHPAPDAPPPPHVTTDTPAPRAPRTVIEPQSEPSPLVGQPERQTNSKPKCSAKAIVDLFNEILTELPQVVMINKDRESKIKARWNESPVHQDYEFWRDYFGAVKESPFLTGKTPGSNGKIFRCSFDWLICPSNFVKVVEGNYRA